MIVDIKPSNRANKRFQVTLNNGKKYHFGYKHGSTYIDHHDKTKRINYWSRHGGNPIEHQLINNLIPSPSLLSAYLLWGPYEDINLNIDFLNQKWEMHH
jgi:hypothetical protein